MLHNRADRNSRTSPAMAYLPLYLDLRGRFCLVIGDSRLAGEKARMLRRAGASVRRRPAFDPRDARGAFLLVGDVGEEEGSRMLRFAEERSIFVNVVDKPALCSFIVPAILQRNELLVSISTSGRSPALASWMRRELESQIGPEYGNLVEVLGATRARVKQGLPRYEDRKHFYRMLLERGLLELCRERGREGTKQHLLKQLEVYRNAE